MKKIFYALLAFTLVGLGVLVWLLKASGGSAIPVQASHEEGVTIVDHEKSSESDKSAGAEEGAHAEGGAKTAENAEHAEHTAEHTTEAHAEHGEAAKSEHGSEHASEAHTKEENPNHAATAKFEVAEKAPQLLVSTEPVPAKVYVNDKLIGTSPVHIEISAHEQMIKLEAPGYESFIRESPSLGTPGVKDAPLVTWKVQMLKKGNAPVHAAAAHDSTHGLAAKHAVTPKATAVHKSPAHAVAEKSVEKATEKSNEESTEKNTENTENTKHAESTAHPAKDFIAGKVGPHFLQIMSTQDPREKVVENLVQLRALLGNDLGSKLVVCKTSLAEKGTWNRFLIGPFKNRSDALGQRNVVRSKLKNRFPEFSEALVTGAQTCLN